MRHGFAVLALALLAACGSAEREAEARQAAEQVVTRIVAKELPGVPPAPVANCAIDSATDDEIVRLLQAELQGVTGRDTPFVLSMLRRDGVRACIASNGVTLPI